MVTSASPPPPNKVPNYDEDVDFDALAVQDADFAKLYNAVNGKVDFQDPKALQYDDLLTVSVNGKLILTQAIDKILAQKRLWSDTRAS